MKPSTFFHPLKLIPASLLALTSFACAPLETHSADDEEAIIVEDAIRRAPVQSSTRALITAEECPAGFTCQEDTITQQHRGESLSFNFSGLPENAGDFSILVTAKGDYDHLWEYIDLRLDQTDIGRYFDDEFGPVEEATWQCSADWFAPAVFSFESPVQNGQITITAKLSEHVNKVALGCTDDTQQVRVVLRYQEVESPPPPRVEIVRSFSEPRQSFRTSNAPFSFELQALPQNAQDVRIQVALRGDYNSPIEFASVHVYTNSNMLDLGNTRIGEQCSTHPNTTSFQELTPSDFTGAPFTIQVTPAPNKSGYNGVGLGCDQNTIDVTVSYVLPENSSETLDLDNIERFFWMLQFRIALAEQELKGQWTDTIMHFPEFVEELRHDPLPSLEALSDSPLTEPLAQALENTPVEAHSFDCGSPWYDWLTNVVAQANNLKDTVQNIVTEVSADTELFILPITIDDCTFRNDAHQYDYLVVGLRNEYRNIMRGLVAAPSDVAPAIEEMKRLLEVYLPASQAAEVQSVLSNHPNTIITQGSGDCNSTWMHWTRFDLKNALESLEDQLESAGLWHDSPYPFSVADLSRFCQS